MSERGKFITFEGADGVGKTTQVAMLRDYLQQRGVEAVITREPGGGPIAEAIRGVLKSNSEIDSVTDLLLFFAARRDHFIKVIEPQLNAGKWVICDRFYDSTLVYQGKLKGVPIEYVMYLKKMTIGDFEPDATVVLDLDFYNAADRVSERNSSSDAYDQMGQHKYDIVREGFRQVAEIYSDRAVIVSASGNKNTVFSKILRALGKKDFRI